MSLKDKTTEKRGGQEKSEGDDSDNDVGDAEGDGDNALKQNGIKQVELGG